MTFDTQFPRNLRILVIDDQEAIHQDYRKIIGPQKKAAAALQSLTADLFEDQPTPAKNESVAFEIDSAFQGKDGYSMVQQALEEGRPYAMAFVDIRMPPGWDGVETVQHIWEIDPEILIVLCSAYSDYSWEAMVKKLGRTDRFLVLKKPFENIEVRQFAIALTERWNLARTDALTGALNRRALKEQLQREWARSIRHEVPLACVMIDLDFFKKVNDIEGHQAGDCVLRSIAALLQTRCRATDLVFRYGGEEFCIILPHTTAEGAAKWAEQVRELIANDTVEIGDRSIRVTASFGVAERLQNMQTAEAVVKAADEALRRAKQSGRNRVVQDVVSESELELARDSGRQRSGLLQGVLAHHVMTHQIATLRRDTTVGIAARFFLDSGINSAPIVDEEGKLIGIVSEIDVLSVILRPNVWDWPISKISQADVVCYDEQTPVEKIFDFLSRVTMRRVTIVADGRPVGSICRSDLLRWFSNWVANEPTLSSTKVASLSGSPKTLLVEAAHSLATRASRLCNELSLRDEESPLSDDLYGPLVDDITSMQNLLRDILTFSTSPLKSNVVLPSLAPNSEPILSSVTGANV